MAWNEGKPGWLFLGQHQSPVTSISPAKQSQLLWEKEIMKNPLLRCMQSTFTDWFNPYGWFATLDPRVGEIQLRASHHAFLSFFQHMQEYWKTHHHVQEVPTVDAMLFFLAYSIHVHLDPTLFEQLQDALSPAFAKSCPKIPSSDIQHLPIVPQEYSSPLGTDIDILAALRLMQVSGIYDETEVLRTICVFTHTRTLEELQAKLERLQPDSNSTAGSGEDVAIDRINQIVVPWLCNMHEALTGPELERCFHYPLAIYVIKYMRQLGLEDISAGVSSRAGAEKCRRQRFSLDAVLNPRSFFKRLHYIPWLSVKSPPTLTTSDMTEFYALFLQFKPLSPALFQKFFDVHMSLLQATL